MKNKRESQKYKKFIELLNFNKGKYNATSVFNDFVVMFAIAIKNAVHFEQKYENTYLDIIQKYSKQENKIFLQLVDELAFLLCGNNETKDVLGEIYQQIGANSNGKGQVFTPTNIARFIAWSLIKKENFINKEYTSISDPSCGAGTMLIEAANSLKQQGIDYKNKVFMKGQDLDFICVCMTYIQLSIYEIPAMVVCGNSLTQENIATFYTPQFVIGKWFEKLRRKEVKK